MRSGDRDEQWIISVALTEQHTNDKLLVLFADYRDKSYENTALHMIPL